VYAGGLCDGVVRYDVWLPGVDPDDETYLNMTQKEAFIDSYLDVVGSQIADQACRSFFTQFACSQVFPPCVDIGADVYVPRLSCQSACNDLHTTCSAIVSAALTVQRTGFVILPVPEIDGNGNCNVDVFGGESVFSSPAEQATHYTTHPFPEGYAGELVFPVEAASYVLDDRVESIDCFGLDDNFTASCDTSPEVQCRSTQIANPYFGEFLTCMGQDCGDNTVNAKCLEAVCPEHLTYPATGLACGRACFNICPDSFLFTEGEYRGMWLAYIIPGLVSLPLNVFVSGGFILGKKTVFKGSRPFLRIAGLLALLWVLLDVVPSAIVYTEMYCNDDTTVGYGEKTYCQFSRGTVHIMQSMYYWMAAAIIDLHQAIIMGAHPGERDEKAKWLVMASCGIPLLMLLWTYGRQVRDAESLDISFDGEGGVNYPNLVWNANKDFFTCSPRLRYFGEEVCVVWIHFIIGAVIIVVLLGQIIKKAISTAIASGSATKSGSSKRGVVKGALATVNRSGSSKMIVLGSGVTTLLICQLVVILDLFPKLEAFSEARDEHYSCELGMRANFQGDECLDDASCCDHLDYRDVGPNATLMAFGYFFPVSAISLVYGIVCAKDKNHIKVVPLLSLIFCFWRFAVCQQCP
jgi:hypothetical protein